MLAAIFVLVLSAVLVALFEMVFAFYLRPFLPPVSKLQRWVSFNVDVAKSLISQTNLLAPHALPSDYIQFPSGDRASQLGLVPSDNLAIYSTYIIRFHVFRYYPRIMKVLSKESAALASVGVLLILLLPITLLWTVIQWYLIAAILTLLLSVTAWMWVVLLREALNDSFGPSLLLVAHDRILNITKGRRLGLSDKLVVEFSMIDPDALFGNGAHASITLYSGASHMRLFQAHKRVLTLVDHHDLKQTAQNLAAALSRVTGKHCELRVIDAS